MTKYTSDKIRNISFIAIIAVFFIHTDYSCDRTSRAFFFQDLIHTCSNYAVPLFFIISGYLFFYKKEELSTIKAGIKKRVRTLLIPYIAWCTLFVLQLWIASRVKTLNQDYFSALSEGNIIEYLRLLKRTYIAPLLAFHLWYVRDLMALVILTPVIFRCQHKRPFLFLILVSIICGLFKVIPWLSWPLTWFSIGSYFAFSKRNLLDINNKWISISMLVCYVVITGWLIHNGVHTTSDKWYSFPVILIGIIGLWNTYDIVGIHKYMSPSLTNQTFLLYCAHVPLLTVISTVVFPLVPSNVFFDGISYLIPALTTCVILLIIARGWKRLNKKSSISRFVYRNLTGGR